MCETRENSNTLGCKGRRDFHFTVSRESVLARVCFKTYSHKINAHILEYVEENYDNVFGKDKTLANRGQMHNSLCRESGLSSNSLHEVGTHTLAVMKYNNSDPFFIIDSCVEAGVKPLRNKTTINN